MKLSTIKNLALLTLIVSLGMMTSCKKGDSTKIIEPVDSLKVGLIAYYPFNNSGIDESGNGNNGMVYNISSVPDRNGKANFAYHFDGATSYITVPDNQALRLSNTDFTINTWEKLDNYDSTYGSIIVCKRGPGSNNGWNYGIHGHIGSNNAILGQTTFIISGGFDPTATGIRTLSIDTWYMLTTVYSISKHQITYYVNGVLDNVVNNIPTPNVASSSDMYIGSDNPAIVSSGYHFKGTLDDMRIYDRALTAAQVQKIYALTY